MNFNEFVKKYLGKAVNYDGVAGVQCVDLAKLYADKVFGLKFGSFGDAHCYYDNYPSNKVLRDNFERIANTPSFVPQLGDLVVWSSRRSRGHGHIAISDGTGGTRSFYTYDFNWDGKGGAMKRIKHDYLNVLGVLRPRNQVKLYSRGYQPGNQVSIVKAVKTGCTEGDRIMCDDGKRQFWVKQENVKDGNITGIGTIAYASGINYIVELNGCQFWINDNDIV